ncbi:MAG: Fic family protein [Candidatus Velthaea sp.]
MQRLPPRAPLAREMRRIWRSEILASTSLAGSRLSAAEVDALLDHGRAQGNREFADYVLVRAYADAARWVADARAVSPGDPRPLVGVDEIRQLNARAAAGTGVRGGAWRQANPAAEAGVIAPAAWMVVREMTALVDRFGRGPAAEPAALWIARFLGRFARLLPFEGANGRTARLTANLMLRRLDYPPLVFEQRDRSRFPRALALAKTNAPEQLADLVARAILRACNRLSATADGPRDAMVALRAAAGDEYPALAKAAQRGRLRTIVRGGRYFTTAGWIAEYRAGSARRRT